MAAVRNQPSISPITTLFTFLVQTIPNQGHAYLQLFHIQKGANSRATANTQIPLPCVPVSRVVLEVPSSSVAFYFCCIMSATVSH